MNDPLFEHAVRTMAVGSRSFTTAARLFPSPTRRSALMLYAWCRHCDDVIDDQELGFALQTPELASSTAWSTQPRPASIAQRSTQSSASAMDRLNELRSKTTQAYAGQPTAEPAFAAFQEVATRHDIPIHLALDHLAGFGMDVNGHVYRSMDDTLLYCYRVAGVVGLMMAHVMGVRDERVLDRACDLGIAFQLTNIARDILDDAAIGRCYVPADWLAREGVTQTSLSDPTQRAVLTRFAAQLVDEAEPYYASALAGLPALSGRCAWAIASARGVYRRIGIRVKAMGDRAWGERVCTSSLEKLVEISMAAGIALKSRGSPGHWRPAPHVSIHPCHCSAFDALRAPGLWTRPRYDPLNPNGEPRHCDDRTAIGA